MVRGQLVQIPPIPVGCSPLMFKANRPRFIIGNVGGCHYRLKSNSSEPQMMCSIYSYESETNIACAEGYPYLKLNNRVMLKWSRHLLKFGDIIQFYQSVFRWERNDGPDEPQENPGTAPMMKPPRDPVRKDPLKRWVFFWGVRVSREDRTYLARLDGQLAKQKMHPDARRTKVWSEIWKAHGRLKEHYPEADPLHQMIGSPPSKPDVKPSDNLATDRIQDVHQLESNSVKKEPVSDVLIQKPQLSEILPQVVQAPLANPVQTHAEPDPGFFKPAGVSNQRKRPGETLDGENGQVQPKDAQKLPTTELPAAIKGKKPCVVFKKLSDLLSPEAASLLEVDQKSTSSRRSLDRSNAPQGSRNEHEVVLRAAGTPNDLPEHDHVMSPAPQRSEADDDNSMATLNCPNNNVDIPNLEDRIRVQEAFGALYIRLKFEAASSELSLSDQVVLYILKKNIQIRILDVVFGESSSLYAKMEVKNRCDNYKNGNFTATEKMSILKRWKKLVKRVPIQNPEACVTEFTKEACLVTRRALKRTLLGCYLGQGLENIRMAKDVFDCFVKIFNE